MVWAVAKTMVRALFMAGHEVVVLDATNTTRARRSEWCGQGWFTRFRTMAVDKEECIRRAANHGDTHILPIIESMAGKFEPVEAGEEG